MEVARDTEHLICCDVPFLVLGRRLAYLCRTCAVPVPVPGSQGSVMDLQKYQEKHGDLVSAARAGESGEWGGDSFQDIIPGDEAIEGMPAEWLQERLGEGTARQVRWQRWRTRRIMTPNPRWLVSSRRS